MKENKNHSGQAKKEYFFNIRIKAVIAVCLKRLPIKTRLGEFGVKRIAKIYTVESRSNGYTNNTYMKANGLVSAVSLVR